MKHLLSLFAAWAITSSTFAAEPIKVLIVDGQNNHAWRTTTPILKKILEDTKLFSVDVATAPEPPRAVPKPKGPNNEEAQKQYREQLAKFKDNEAKYKRDFSAFRPK